jgi:hypothetical protein
MNAVTQANAKKSTAAQTKAKPTTQARTKINQDVRSQMIAEAAYYNAQKRNFTDGSAEQDWLTAEAEVDKVLYASNN